MQPVAPPPDEPPPSQTREPTSHWSRAWLDLVPRFDLGIRRVRRAFLALVERFLPSEAQHLFALTLAVGAVSGFVAVAFHLAIQFAENLLIERALHASGRSWMVWTIVTPTLGGLLAGFLLARYLPGARGSGIPQVKVAYADGSGRIRARDALGKFFISTLQIGSGASLGREGPTVQICAGATSLIARLTSFPPRNLRRLMPVGVAAGIAAAFNAPVAAVTFTIEEIVGTLDHTVLSGVVVAAALAAVIERGILGVHPVIRVATPYSLDHGSSLLLYAVLGLCAGLLSILFTDGLLKLRAWFGKSRLPLEVRPAVGGLLTGALAVLVLEFLGRTGINGGGYDTLGAALEGQLPLLALLGLGLAKFLATLFSYSSGGAGGIFAPTLFVGAMIGGAFGHLDVLAFEHGPRSVGAFALVGMGAFFAGVIRSPMTSVLIIFEMTGGYGLILPLMLANMSSYTLARRYRPKGIYESLLAQDGVELVEPQPLQPAPELKAGDLMRRNVKSISATATLAEAQASVGSANCAMVPITNADNVVEAAVWGPSLEQASPGLALRSLFRPAITVDANAPLSRAVLKMHELETRELIVVDPNSRRLLGILAVQDLIQARARQSEFSVPLGGHHPSTELEFGSLALAAREIPASTRLHELVSARQEHEPLSYLVRLGDQFGIILPQHLNEFAREANLEKMLIAADVARPALAVLESANLSELVTRLGAVDDVALVLVNEAGTPVGILPRERLGEYLLQRYANEMASLRP